ncbi:translation initiation factor IF-2-like [Pipra filicauda]|uniref:Translation initiation factor IF-2-like n=1 Tax=Pipra filicauda TaxID=649802 RepID=A0A6J2HLQ4_9PASS|nr:translation initiation factor IF-2-like [Pipra filicauda]
MARSGPAGPPGAHTGSSPPAARSDDATRRDDAPGAQEVPHPSAGVLPPPRPDDVTWQQQRRCRGNGPRRPGAGPAAAPCGVCRSRAPRGHSSAGRERGPRGGAARLTCGSLRSEGPRSLSRTPVVSRRARAAGRSPAEGSFSAFGTGPVSGTGSGAAARSGTPPPRGPAARGPASLGASARPELRGRAAVALLAGPPGALPLPAPLPPPGGSAASDSAPRALRPPARAPGALRARPGPFPGAGCAPCPRLGGRAVAEGSAARDWSVLGPVTVPGAAGTCARPAAGV